MTTNTARYFRSLITAAKTPQEKAEIWSNYKHALMSELFHGHRAHYSKKTFYEFKRGVDALLRES